MKDTIKKSVLVISSYPDSNNSIRDLNAVAWYSQKIFQHNRKNKIIVLSEIIDTACRYKDGDITVFRTWRRNSARTFWDIIKAIIQNKELGQAKTVIVEFEFHMFGGIFATAFFSLFLLILKLLRKNVVVELHQVALNLKNLSGHLNLQKNSSLTRIFGIIMPIFYVVIGLLADTVVVLEEEFRQRLLPLIPTHKILTSFIPVQQQKTIDKKIAREALGLKKTDFVLIYFGFLTWYKGIDWLVEAFLHLSRQIPNLKLIIAGGESFTLRQHAYYQQYTKRIQSRMKRSRKIIYTGFLENNEITHYFSAADLAVLPYRTMMSTSGPLNIALSYKKPVLLSNKLLNYAKSNSVKQALKKSRLKQDDLFFELNEISFKNALLNNMKKFRYHKLELFTRILALKRSYKNFPLEAILKKGYEVTNKVKKHHGATFASKRGCVAFLKKLFPRKLVFRLG